MTTPAVNESARIKAQGLRDLADWIDENADFFSSGEPSRATMLICRLDKDEFIDGARRLGECVVQPEEGKYLTLVREFGPINVHLYIPHEKVGAPESKMVEQTVWTLDDDVRDALAEVTA